VPPKKPIANAVVNLRDELRAITGYARYGHAFKRRHEDRPPRKGRGVSSR
jgi:hypothetical protein